MEPTNRYLALELAVRNQAASSGGVSITDLAQSYLAFLEGAPAATGSGEAAAPKVTRRRTTASGAAEKESAPSTTATNATEADASTAKSDPATDDLFGEEPAAEVKEVKVKKLTVDDVKVALVEVQTALKHKDHALALLSKHTVPKGEKVLSKLPEANYAALIKEADSAIKAGKVTP